MKCVVALSPPRRRLELVSKPYAIAATRVSVTADPRRYHVLSGKVLSSDLEVGMEPKTLEGSTIEVTSLTPPTINGDSVIGPADVLATNGVIHVIDTVLMPGSDDEPTMGPTAMEESDSAGRASLAVAAAAAVAYVL